MPLAQVELELLAPVEDVWRFLAEPRHLADWWPGIAAVEPDRRGLVAGARWIARGTGHAPVFLALVLGILIGVAISGRGFVDKAERKQLNARIADLRRSRDTEKTRADALQARQQASDEFVTQAYPLLMKDRLRGKKVAV